MNKIKAILEYAMRMENDAEEFYAYNLDRVQSPSLKKLFEELAEMEKTHYSMLSIMHDKLNITPLPISISWVVDNVSKEINPSILADNSDLIANEKNITDLSIVRMAYLIESDLAMFYKNAAAQVDDNAAKEFLLELGQWEAQHEATFRAKYEELLKNSWSDLTSIIFN